MLWTRNGLQNPIGLAFLVLLTAIQCQSIRKVLLACWSSNSLAVSENILRFYRKTETFSLVSRTILMERCYSRMASGLTDDFFAEFVLRSYVQNKINFRDDFLTLWTTNRKALTELSSRFDLAGLLLSAEVQVDPIFFWAQSKSRVFLKIEYKISRMAVSESGPDLRIVTVRPDYLDARFFFVRQQSDGKLPIILLYRLKLDYFNSVDPRRSIHGAKNDYSYQLELKKSYDILWRNVHYKANKIFRNQFTWMELFMAHQKDLIEDFAIWKKTQQLLRDEERARERNIRQKIAERKRLAQLKRLEAEKMRDFRLQDEFCFLLNDSASQPCFASNGLSWNEWIV